MSRSSLYSEESEMLKLAEEAFNVLQSEEDEPCKDTDETEAAEKYWINPMMNFALIRNMNNSLRRNMLHTLFKVIMVNGTLRIP